MPRSLQSATKVDSTMRSINVPSLFSTFSLSLRAELKRKAVRRVYQDGALIQHRGDHADGFYIVERGQVKIGHFNSEGEMQVLLLLGQNDSFGELACLGEFRRVVDAQSLGETEISWISDEAFLAALASDPLNAQQLIKLLASQLQESLDLLIVFRKMPAVRRLAQTLLAMAEGRAAPVQLSIRKQDLAELVGVSRMTITTALDVLEEKGFLTRFYRGIEISDLDAMRRWMRG
jgi:CRP/FNR family transcriptional regulator, cyclic AMP receptor protein